MSVWRNDRSEMSGDDWKVKNYIWHARSLAYAIKIDKFNRKWIFINQMPDSRIIIV